jgi:HEPN domain-containing protein
MTADEIDEMVKAMSDEELKANMKQAGEDLNLAASEEPESEWHQACFAAVLTYAQELSRRVIRMVATH